MRGAVAVAFLLAGATLAAQPPAEPVAIDLVVDGGTSSPLTLSEADLTVTEAGEAVQVRSVQFVRASQDTTPLPAVTSEDDERAAAAAGGRLLGVFVDEYHLADDSSFRTAQAALAAFIRTALGPRDLVMVVKPLDPLVSLRMTTDREAAARILEAAVPRQGDYAPRSTFEQEFIAGAPARIDAARNQIALSAISALAQHLGRFSAGRKTLLIVSNGIAAVPASRGEGALPGLESITRVANRSRVAVYSMRPTPVDAPVTQAVSDQRQAPVDPLDLLATRTTGVVFDGADAPRGLQQLLRDASGYYLLSLDPPVRASDGRLHAVSVKVRKPGVSVRARAAYSLPQPEATSFVPHGSAIPEGLRVPRHSSPLIRTWFGQSAGADGTTSIDVVWEPAPLVPGVRGVIGTPARIAMTVSTLDGATVYSGTAGPSGRDSDVVQTGRPQMTFSTRPGRFLVQMDVLDPAGRVLDREIRDLSVSAFKGPLTFGTAAVFRSRTALEFRAIVAGTSNAAPAAARQFSRTEHLVVRIPVSSPGEEPTVTARLKSRFGSTLRELAVTEFPEAHDFFQVDIPLAPLASGGYALEFSARSSLGSAVDRLEFVVTP